jgi:hypothetical protein
MQCTVTVSFVVRSVHCGLQALSVTTMRPVEGLRHTKCNCCTRGTLGAAEAATPIVVRSVLRRVAPRVSARARAPASMATHSLTAKALHRDDDDDGDGSSAQQAPMYGVWCMYVCVVFIDATAENSLCGSCNRDDKGREEAMSNNPATTPVSNTALATNVGNDFFSAVQATCETKDAALLICDMQDIVLTHCRANITCENKATVTSVTCDPQQAAQALSEAFNKNAVAPAQLGAMQTLGGPLAKGGGLPTTAGGIADLYAQVRCSSDSYASQTIVFPKIVLSDCSGVTITGLNELDATARCAFGTISELVPPDPEPLSSSPPVPIWENPLHMTLLMGGCLVLIVLGAGVGLLLRGKSGPLPGQAPVQRLAITVNGSPVNAAVIK